MTFLPTPSLEVIVVLMILLLPLLDQTALLLAMASKQFLIMSILLPPLFLLLLVDQISFIPFSFQTVLFIIIIRSDGISRVVGVIH